jgi:hypothetical protein
MRSVIGLSPTSTMREAPEASKWEKSGMADPSPNDEIRMTKQ